MKPSKTSLGKNSLTIHILTKNNAKTIHKTLQSLSPCEQRILVADMGSSDNTMAICRSFGIKPISLGKNDRDVLRNRMSELSSTEWNMYVEPWEAVLQGYQTIKNGPFYNSYVTLIQGDMVSKEMRFWKKDQKFVNRVFERIDCDFHSEADVLLYSSGRSDYVDLLKELDGWKHDNPTAPTPYYYCGLVLMALGNYEEFLRCSEHYMHLTAGNVGIDSTMNRYYYAMATLIHRKKIKPVLQNINLCLRHKPLMPEFWCLIGDAYYHISKNFPMAVEFYENAILLGKHRLKDDRWPMDVSKYKDYPERMIESCRKLIDQQTLYKKDL
jgi:glycosyltransferase involved in cell wall biosynthesis